MRNFQSSPEDKKPPQLSFKLKKAGDLPKRTETWSDDHLPIDILLLTGVESCNFLSCFTFLDQPFKLYRKDIGVVYIGRMGNSSVQEKLKVALMNCSKGAAAPGGSLTVVLNAVRVLQPKAVFSVGTCISLGSEKARMGDVVISSKLSTAEGFRTPGSPRLGSLVRDAPYGWDAPLKNPDEWEVKVHCGGDILSQSLGEKCQYDDICEQYPEAVAIETEGEGVYAAAYDANIEWVVVKGVASYFHQSHSASSEWISFASTMAASVVGKMLSDPTVFREWPHYNQVSDPFDLVKYISIIRQLYEDREGWLAPFPWCEEFRFSLDNIFTRLKFVSRKKERGIKTDVIVDLFQIFKPHQECSQPRRVLIEGQPGMGKTTFCQKIAYDWAKKRKGGNSFPDVTLVLLLKCRDINCGLWEAIDDQLLPREVKEEDKERFFTFIREHQSKVLLVLDGLDEFPRGQLSIYTDIIQGRVLPQSYIVVTARHEVGVKVRECCHTLLEVEGFTKTDAEEFIRRYFKEEHLAEKLLNKLDTDETLRGLTRNPLNTALLCLLCEDFGGKFPDSRTQLYLGIVECVLRRYRLKMKLPETDQDLVALYRVELKELGRIAMESLRKNSLYFDESAFQGFSSDVKSGLGFLSVEAGRSKRRPGRSYGFLHKSFQEFFAALCHSCQLLDGEISVNSLIADWRYFQEFRQVLMFIGGMLAQKCEAAVKALIAGIATQVNLEKSPLEVAWACINECKREGNTFDKEVAQFFGSHLKLQRVFCER
ncbi:NACHT, LRR and PYD domains-containing protein 12-like [Acropora millepora]|uniref:NACHT, LRR and PYD domains-containing protein 12-like n=1 Tax=Acropora millepora TaxID=45264 RepID=UPI001CF5601B|nr:NACHT, LRR and PYD domains-containing protein 12-like [Acropora millepora]